MKISRYIYQLGAHKEFTMFINQANLVDKYTNQNMESGKTSAAEIGKTGGVFDYQKTQEAYRMTESGSFFMPEAVYQKPEGKEEETVMDQLDSQMDMTAENRKNQMIVVSNTASAQDLEEIGKEGFSTMDMDSRAILTVTDKIKATLAKAGVDISIYGDDLSVEQLEAATGSSALANQIVKALKAADLPTTDANVEEGTAAYAAAEAMLPLSDASKSYLVKNGQEPSIKNLYMAAHSGMPAMPQKGIDFAALENQMKQIIVDAGLPVAEETMNNCRWLIEQDIPLTVSNLRYLEGLNQLSEKLTTGTENELDMEYVLNRIMEAVTDGKRPMDALLIDGFSNMDKAQNVMNVITLVQEADVAYCVDQQMILTVENLQTAIANREEATELTVGAEISTDITFITAKRQLEETRLAMTVEANYALLKRGIAIDTKPLEQLVEDLKGLEEQYYKDLLSQAGIDSTEESVEILSTTTKYVAELKYQPAYVLQLDSEKDTLQHVHQAGSALKTTMDAALQSYETLWTAPRRDMGDSIQRAFANVDDILADLELEATAINQRAVRILAYNQTEITVENITQIKNVDMQMQKLFGNLTPAVTMEMIRKGHNPLDMEIGALNELVENIQSELGNKEEERFSKYLWKLEQNKEISQEERDSYIGIYRLIAQVEKTDGAPLGALLNQGSDITMRNLLTAMRSARKSMDYSVDDEFAGVDSSVKGPRIDQQIMASYQTNCVKEAMDILSPEKLVQMEEWENMTPEQFLAELQKATTEQQSVALEQQYYSEMAQEYCAVMEASDDVYAFLERYDMKNSANNVLAVSRLLENPSNVFEVLFAEEGKSQHYREAIAEMKEQILQRFGEAVKTPEEMAQAQETLAEVAERAMQSMIIENETISVKDLKDLRLMNQQLFLCKEKAKEESFLVPVATGDSVTGVSLKIVRGKDNKGLVDIFFRGALMEKVAASFEAKENGISGVIATTDEETRKLFAENLGLLTEKMNAEGQEPMDIRVARVTDLSMWQFEKNTLSEKGEKSQVQTKRLYHIAESFIQTVSALME